jgi:hypothetical protein
MTFKIVPFATGVDESLRDKDGLSLVKEFVDDSGGPYSRHLHSETEMDSFDSSCSAESFIDY